MIKSKSLLGTMVVAALAFATVPAAAATPSEDLAFGVQEYAGGRKTNAFVVSKLLTLNLPKKCFEKVLDKKRSRAIEMIGGTASILTSYAKQATGDDWPNLEAQTGSSQEINRARVEKLVDQFGHNFHLTLNLEGDDCGVATEHDLWMQYLRTTARALSDYPPRAGKAFVTINVTAAAKGVKTEVSADGATFTITGSRDVQTGVWSDDIAKPFKRVSTKS